MATPPRRAPWSRAVVALATFALVASAQAQPVKFFGQDPEPSPALSLPPDGAAATARAEFLGNLDVATVGTEDFDAVTITDPGTAAAAFTVTFPGSTGTITGSATANNGRIITGDDGFGAFATSPTQALKSSGSLAITFSAPISAFGAYINDVETTDTIRFTLTPDGGGAAVVVEYGGIINQGRTGRTPGNGQLSFVGFIDTNTLYTAVTVSFEGAAGEGFGFDDLTVGDAAQVTSTQATVVQADISDQPGWRLLSAPVEGVSVDALALQNLVQGIPSDGVVQGQYPDAGFVNVYTAYQGGGRYDYVAPATTATTLVPGRGFWWYWFDQAIDPPNDVAGGGTSESVVLDDFALTGLGPVVDADAVLLYDDNTDPAGTTPGGDPLSTDDDFYMIGNPFPDPLAADAVSVIGGTLQDGFLIWNPANDGGTPPTGPDPTLDGPGSYEIVYAAPPGGGGPDLVAVWQGMMAEVTAPTGAQVTVTIDDAGRTPAGTPPFYGRRPAERFAALELTGETVDGARVRDAAATVRLLPTGTDAWDRHDLTKLLPPSDAFAVVALVGTREGAPYRQAGLSLPDVATAEVPVAFAASDAGTFTLAATGTLADEGAMLFTDHATGATADLAAEPYTFTTTEASDWTDRFTLRLSGAATAADDAPGVQGVGPVSPNPTAGPAWVTVTTVEGGVVSVAVYDVLGRQVARTTEALAAGTTAQIALPLADLSAGAYAVRVEGAGVAATRAVTISR